MSLPPPGMYIDPLDAGRMRFWNGSAWTDHVEAAEGTDPTDVPMYAPPPRNAAPPLVAGVVDPLTAPPPDPATATYPGAPATVLPSSPGLPMGQRPMSTSAIWSIPMALACPFIGLIFAMVALNATSPRGDRRGRGVAWVGFLLALVNAVAGLWIASTLGGTTTG